MKKSQEQALRQKVGDLASICGIKDYTFNDGPARGMRAFDLDNGRNVRMTVLADRGLDIPAFQYKGENIAFHSKTGLRSPFLYQEDGGVKGWLRQFNAGLLTTCGLTHAGALAVDGRMCWACTAHTATCRRKRSAPAWCMRERKRFWKSPARCARPRSLRKTWC